jgi:hypothetical protein
MGLFNSQAQEPLSNDLAAVLVGVDKPTLKAVSREQATIRAALEPGESLILIGADHPGGPAGAGKVAVVTCKRLFFVRRNRVERQIDAGSVRRTWLGRKLGERYLVFIEPHTSVEFPTDAQAQAFAEAIDQHLLSV